MLQGDDRTRSLGCFVALIILSAFCRVGTVSRAGLPGGVDTLGNQFKLKTEKEVMSQKKVSIKFLKDILCRILCLTYSLRNLATFS